MRVVHRVPIGTVATGRLLVVEAATVGSAAERYVLPLVIVEKPRGDLAGAEAVVAVLDDGRLLCDGIYVPEIRAELLRLIVEKRSTPGRPRIAGTSHAKFDAPTFRRALRHSRVVGADQSNTSIVYGEAWFLKLFRKYERGPNPDLELTQFLSEQRGYEHVPHYLGGLHLIAPEGDGALGLLVSFTPNRGDAWTFALTALDGFFARVLATRSRFSAHAVARAIGRAFLGRVRQLGRRTAEMHLALASGGNRPAFSAEPYTLPYQRELCESLRASAGRVLSQLRRQAPLLPGEIRAEAVEVIDGKARILRSLRRLTRARIAVTKTRIHGDYHLGQVLNTGKDFVILDFEGEPRRSLAERLLKRSPLVDVAGMVRSFDYAGAFALRGQKRVAAARLEPWARAWVAEVTRAFLDAYFAVASGAAFLPVEADDLHLLLNVFVLEKAVYEIGYELSYRPDFLSIPLRAVSRLLREME